MLQEVIAVFDIGKTNKKVLLFNRSLSLVFQEEKKFREILDDDGFACDDIEKIESWMYEEIVKIQKKYAVKAINFSTYGATLVYLNADGERLTPVYNYLKPMPEGVLDGFYIRYGGKEEFCRNTASPALGMLNSGLQMLWLKKCKPEVFGKVHTILHFPQYLSYCLTRKRSSEYTSIGCHTALWDFDRMAYHPWLADEMISLPTPIPNRTVYDVKINGKIIKVGTGIHDSSASLVPYLKGSVDPFILMSTGTWCISMNPFNDEPLTSEQLRKDTLCFLSVNQKQVKSSRLFLGHIHDVNVERLTKYFDVAGDHFKFISADSSLLNRMRNSATGRVFFKNGVPGDYIDTSVDLSRFLTFGDAYSQFMVDIVDIAIESLQMIIPVNDDSKIVYVSGGFAKNELFVKLLAMNLPDKKVFTSEIDNATALGAAMMVSEKAFGNIVPDIDLGLKMIV